MKKAGSMFNPFEKINKVTAALTTIATLAVLAVLAYAFFASSKTIYELLGENRVLKESITRLTEESVVGYAKVLRQETREGRLFTTIVFVATDSRDPGLRLLEKEFELEGDVIFFDALIVKFQSGMVMDGKERALFLWRRVYSDKMKPEDGFPIEISGDEPARYSDLFARLSTKDRALFWAEIWKLAEDTTRLEKAGVRAVYGNAVYKKLRPGLIYRFSIDASGNFFPESVPDL